MKLPDIIPLFPLPNVVFFPRMPLPLHIFEPRYRAMVRDAARGRAADRHGAAARRLGAGLRTAARRSSATGTVGEMVRMEELPDGRFNIVLRGLREFVIHRELDARGVSRGGGQLARRRRGRRSPADARERSATLVLRYLAAHRAGTAAGERAWSRAASTTRRSSTSSPSTSTSARSRSRRCSRRRRLGERARRLVDVLEFRLEELRTHPGGPPPRAH